MRRSPLSLIDLACGAGYAWRSLTARLAHSPTAGCAPAVDHSGCIGASTVRRAGTDPGPRADASSARRRAGRAAPGREPVAVVVSSARLADESRPLRRARERCCDEEVIASLGYEPTQYGRGLLNVLKLKRQWTLPAAVPGIRPFEVTRRRLEYLVSSSGLFRQRMPRRYWPGLAACAQHPYCRARG